MAARHGGCACTATPTAARPATAAARAHSVWDPSVPDHLRGKYRAFCPQHLYPGDPGRLSNGLRHLQELQQAGLNHIHLLPTYDYGSVPERAEEQAHVLVRVESRWLW
jgi:pullulanase/glycogen debranching enzyme